MTPCSACGSSIRRWAAVVIRSGKPGVFCAGANIRMLSKATHGHKVNFCKFTNETRMAIEDATANSGQTYIAAVSGTAAGGGYELAVTAEHIMLIDDRRSTVSLPELPLLAVLPGTGGLTRVTDKRRVRRDRADVFCATEEGACAAAVPWNGAWWTRWCPRPAMGRRRHCPCPRDGTAPHRSRRPQDAPGVTLHPAGSGQVTGSTPSPTRICAMEPGP